MKFSFSKKPKKERENPRLGGISFAFSEDGKRHVVSVEDMPEDVRAYFEELGGQMREEDGDGRLFVNSDNLPDYVSEYMHKQAARVLTDMTEDDIDTARLADLPREAVEGSVGDLIERTFRRFAKKAPDCKDELQTAVGPLKAIFKILLHTDEDWQALEVAEAGRLYCGVCMAMMEAVIMASRLNDVGFSGGKEARDDEEDEEDS